jgi:hypothetical protein
MLPTHQSLAPTITAAADIDLGLVVEHKLLLAQGFPQTRFHRTKFPGPCGHFGDEITKVLPPDCLATYMARSAFESGFPPPTILGENADADAGADIQFIFIDFQRSVKFWRIFWVTGPMSFASAI